MARVKLELPEHFIFSTDIPIRIDDINYGGHLGNDAVLSLIHEARLRFLISRGYKELDIEGVGILMADAVIVYKSEGFYGDILKIELTANDFSKYGCDFVYRMTQQESQKEVARAKTGIVFYDYTIKKVVRVPQKFKEIFVTLESANES